MQITIMKMEKYLKWIDSYSASDRSNKITEEKYDEFFNDLAYACSQYGSVNTEGDFQNCDFSMSRYVSISRMINILLEGKHITKELILAINSIICSKWPDCLASFDCEIGSLDIIYSIAVRQDTIVCAYENNRSKVFLQDLHQSFKNY
jgi:hypothetical protein